jgi:hypothetical protein
MNYFESLPDPTEDDLYKITADEYLESIGIGATEDSERRRKNTYRMDLDSELAGQIEHIDGLVQDYAMKKDKGLEDAIEEAKIDLGRILVDRLNQPPA